MHNFMLHIDYAAYYTLPTATLTMENDCMVQPHKATSALDSKTISFTAHYTSYIWYTLGWSHTGLTTNKGKWLTYSLKPFEWLGEHLFGTSIRANLKQRHTLINNTLNQLLQQHPDLQILEIAAGLSPRGWNYRRLYPHITYIEADLKDMAHIKAQKLHALGDSHTPIALDVFHMDMQTLLTQLDTQKPLVIINEGLINYFGPNLVKQAWKNYAELLQHFKVGYYISDLYPIAHKKPYANTLSYATRLLKKATRSHFELMYTSTNALQHDLTDIGFTRVDVHTPRDAQLNVLPKDDGNVVWVFMATHHA